MSQTEQSFRIRNYSAGLRYTTLHGRKHLIVPLRMIKPGVLSGSNGPLYYPPDEVAKNPEVWNGMPVTIGHPTFYGDSWSAREPGIFDSSAVGSVFNSRIDNGVLVAEGWLDVERLKAVDSRVYDRLLDGQPLEVSTGLQADYEPAEDGATFNGRAYTHTVRNLRPDHLAILPDHVGACSLKDGCGALVNSVDSKLSKEIRRRLRRRHSIERNQSVMQLPFVVQNMFGLQPHEERPFDPDADLLVRPTINWQEEAAQNDKPCGCTAQAQPDDAEILLPRPKG